ncbi:MAG: TIGR02710 family CRISPR-associated CARF protein [Bradymonadaceae bacterium]
MFATLGRDSGVVRSIVFAVEELNPDRLVLLASSASREDRGRAVVEALTGPDDGESDEGLELADAQIDVESGTYAGLSISFPGGDELDRTDDAEALQIAYREIIRDELAPDTVRAEHAVADFTGGTKPMSAALYAAAYSADVPLLNYVTGERDDEGEVVGGTERTHQVRARRLSVRDTLREAHRLFRSGDYRAAYRRAESTSACPDMLLPYAGDARALLSVAGRALDAWSRFRFDEALDQFQRLGDDQVVGAQFVGERFVTKHRRNGIQRHLHRAREQQSDDDPSYVGLAADLANNADRAAERGAHDDAIARLYRAIEYLGQVQLWREYELSTSEFPAELLPDRADTEEEFVSIGLRDAWEFLAEEGEPLGELWRELDEREAFRTAMYQRNHSLLAHGFQPVDPEYVETLRRAVDQLGREGWGEDRWEELLERTAFPSIDGLDV